MLDMIIKNAEVFDGTGAPPRVMNVGVLNGKIVSCSNTDDLKATVVIDGNGMALSSGFIDVHTHSDVQLYLDPSRWCKLKQGVTTEVGGQCGWSPAPYSRNAPDSFREYIGYEKYPYFDTFAEAMEHLDTMKIGTHQATFVGHLYLRGSVLGMENRHTNAAEIERMCALAEEAMQSGALGLSTGLVYAPGIYAATDELSALAKVVGRYGGLYTTHIRDEGDRLIEAVEEAIHIGAEGGIPVNISHLKAMFPENYHKIDIVLEMIDKANSHGAQITFDVYPYTACSAGIRSTLPPSYLTHSTEWLVEHLQGKENIEMLRKAIYEPTEVWENPFARIGAENHLIARATMTPEIVGMRISDYAKLHGLEDIEAYAEIIRLNRGVVQDIRFAMSEENIEKLYAHPLCMVGSDGLYQGDGNPAHVRAFATFPRYLGRYIRDKKILPFEEGIRRVTGMAADRYGLKGKGYIKEGYDADLVLFDKNTICDKATYTNPFIPNEGIQMVFVGGEAAVVDNELTGVMQGRKILRSKETGKCCCK